MSKFCPDCGSQSLVFVRDSVFQMKLYKCSNCDTDQLLRPAPTADEEARAKAPEPKPVNDPAQEPEGEPTAGKPPQNEESEDETPKGGSRTEDSEEEGEAEDTVTPVVGAGGNEDGKSSDDEDDGPDIDKAMALGELLSNLGSTGQRQQIKPEDLGVDHVTYGGESVDQDVANMLSQKGGSSYTSSEREKIKLNLFYQKLGNVMKDNQFDRLLDNQRRGKLTPRNLFKVFTGSDKVFSRKLERKNKKYAVVIVVDESGSMGSVDYDPATGKHIARSEAAAACVKALITGLSKHHMRFGVIGFGTDVLVRKELNQKIDLEELTKEIAYADLGGTSTFAALMATEKMIKSADPEEQIITLFISDGQPASDGTLVKNRQGFDVMDHTGCEEGSHSKAPMRAEVAHLASYGTFIPISIQCPILKDWFPVSHIVKNVGEFADVVLGEFGRAVKRG